MKIKYLSAALTAAFALSMLSACKSDESYGGGVDNGIEAIEDAMSKANTVSENTEKETDELRSGTSDQTVAAPDDLPAEYNYGTGKISDYSRDMMLKKLPEPSADETVLNTEADPDNIQVMYLWEEGNVPAKTSFTENMTGYFDSYDFRPYVTAIYNL